MDTAPFSKRNRTSSEPSRHGGVPPASAQIDRLVLDVDQGVLDGAFMFLRGVPAADLRRNPAVEGLRRAVAFELVRTTPLDAELPAKLVNAFALAPVFCERIALDETNCMHLVARSERDPEDLTRHWWFACGLHIEQDIFDPLAPAVRGCWQEPGPHLANHCSECARHAAAYPETREPGDAYQEWRAIAADLAAVARERTLDLVHERLSELVNRAPDQAYGQAAVLYEETITAELVRRAQAGGESFVKRIIAPYYDDARRELADCGYSRPLGELISEGDWLRAAHHALEDVADEEGVVIAPTSYLYLELRGVLGSRVRAMRKAAA